MIPFRRVTSGPPTVTPPRRPTPVIPQPYSCAVCEVTGRGTRCWCCDAAMGEGR